MSRSSGFTLVELITTMMLLGILAFVAIPRFGDTRIYGERAFRDQALNALRHAQRMAVASRRASCVNVTAGTGASATIALRRDPADPDADATADIVTRSPADFPRNCLDANGVALALPAPGCAANVVCAPDTVTLGFAVGSVIFDRDGRPYSATGAALTTAATMTISGQPDIVIEPETGYAH